MGTDRNIVAKRDIKAGECVATAGRAYHLMDLPDDQEIWIELFRIVRLYDTDFEAFIKGMKAWVETIRNIERRDMLFNICDEYSELKWEDG